MMIRDLGLCRRTTALLVSRASGHVALVRTCRMTLRARCSATSSSAGLTDSPAVSKPAPSALCVAVVDAFEFEGTSAAVAKQVQGAKAVVLAITGTDRLPRLGSGELQYLRRRFERQGGGCVSVVGIPSTEGESLTSLSAEVLAQADTIGAQHILVAGVPDQNRRALLSGLQGEMLRLRDVEEDAPIVPEVSGIDVKASPLWSRGLWPGQMGEMGEEAGAGRPARVEVGEWTDVPSGEELCVEYTGRPAALGDVGGSGGGGGDGRVLEAAADGGSGAAAKDLTVSLLYRLQIRRTAEEDEAKPMPVMARLFAPVGVGLCPTAYSDGGAGEAGGGGREGSGARGAEGGGRAGGREDASICGAGGAATGGDSGAAVIGEGTPAVSLGRDAVGTQAWTDNPGAAGRPMLSRRRRMNSDYFKFMAGHAVEVAMPGVGWLTLCHSGPFSVWVHSPLGAEAVSRRPMYPRTFTPRAFTPRDVLYAEHLPAHQLQGSAAQADLIVGKLIVTFSNPTCGFVPLDSSAGPKSRSIALKGREAMNRALHGDRVAVKLVRGPVSGLAAPEGARAQGAAPEWAAEEGAAEEGAGAGGARAELVRAEGTAFERAPPEGAATEEGAASADEAVAPPAGGFGWAGHAGAAGTPADDASDEDGMQDLRQEHAVRQEHAAPDSGLGGEGGGVERAPAAVSPAAASARARSTCGEGQVVGILERLERRLIVLFESAQQATSVPRVATPRDARYPRVQLNTSTGQPATPPASLVGQLLVARVTGWSADQQLPSAELVRPLGEAGSLAAETEAYLIENNVAVEPFSTEVLGCLPPANFTIPQAEIDRRLDLRGGPAQVYSIDPPGCVDIDDALHLRPLSNGLYEVGVHIADVTHFVLPGSPLDVEAARRAETFYLVNQRANMVPELLSEDLCSLHPHSDRLAFSVLLQMDEEATVLSSRFEKTVIRSSGALSYKQAQARIDDADSLDPLTKTIQTLNRLAGKLRQRRMREGALTLASSEVKFELEIGADGKPDPKSLPTAMALSTSDAAHSLIEEFMVLANCLVARRTAEAFPDQYSSQLTPLRTSCELGKFNSAVLRLHPPPQHDDFAALERALSRQGIAFDARTSADLARSLAAARKPGDPDFNHVVRLMATRCIAPARYFRSGALPPEEWSHCGLAEPVYTHFTSPIRRYADQLVHRLLAQAIGWERTRTEDFTAENLEAVTAHMNERHQMAQAAERASSELYTMLFFRGRKVTKDAYILRVQQHGVTVLVPEYGIEVYTHLVPPGVDSPFEFHPSRDELAAGGCVLRMLDRIRVQIGVEFGPLLKPRLAIEIVEPRLPTTAKLKPDDHEDGVSRRVSPFGSRKTMRQRGTDERTGRRGGGKRLSAKAERRRPVEFRQARR